MASRSSPSSFFLSMGGLLVELALADPLQRVARQADHAGAGGGAHTENPLLGGNSSNPDDNKPRGELGPSLGQILAWLFLVCCILYCIGIGYKIMKIVKGTYVEEEPVFLKYK